MLKKILNLFDRRIRKKDREEAIEKCDHKYDVVGKAFAPLLGGRHTSFMILRCIKCKSKTGFPSDNLKLAFKEGTEETKMYFKISKLDIE